MKYFIISQPKAGTYLAANLLTEFGITFDGLHFSKRSYQHYNLNNLVDSRINRKKYTFKKPIAESILHVKDNCLGVGHLEYSKDLEILIADFKKILLIRDLKSTEDSWKAWASITRKGNKSKLLDDGFRRNIEQWRLCQDVFVLDFYDMKNQNITKINELQLHLFGAIIKDSKSAISSALKKESLTKLIRKQDVYRRR